MLPSTQRWTRLLLQHRRGLATLASLPNKTSIAFTRRVPNVPEKYEHILPGVAVEQVHAEKAIQTTFPSSDYRFAWAMPPKNVLIVQKPGDLAAREALLVLAAWLHKQKSMNVIVEEAVAQAHPDVLAQTVPFVGEDAQHLDELTRAVDFVIALGGDGTLLHVSSLFRTHVPPVLCFSLGSLGFLMPFAIGDYPNAVESAIAGNFSFVPRMRLSCSVHSSGKQTAEIQAMNDAVIHRGHEPHLARIDILVNGELMTSTQTDGLIVATPTGSTAYSLSAGGSVVHPSVKGMLLTPICARSLSFRPAILPPDASIEMRVSDMSRATAAVSFDGRHNRVLAPGDVLKVTASHYPVPTITREPGRTSDWVNDINTLLKWNMTWE